MTPASRFRQLTFNRRLALRLSLYVKGIDAVLEVIGGILLLMPVKVSNILIALCEHELLENPHDATAKYIRGLAGGLLSVTLASALYLMVHGLVKLIFISAVFKERLWGYVGLIIVLAAFTIFEIYRAFSTPLILVLAFFDGLIVYLATKEYQARRSST